MNLLFQKLNNNLVFSIRMNILFVLLISFFLSACSLQTVSRDKLEYQIPLPETLSKTDSYTKSPHYWWYARFKMVWSEDIDAIEFYNDLIVAHQIINPMLERHHQNIKLWRFHRRAAKDSSGHQFSFIFYATPEIAREIYRQIKQNPLSQQLINEAIVKKIQLDNPDKPNRSAIEDTSDPNWSVTVQKSWPYFIMGVSILWLDILNQESEHKQVDTSKTIQAQLQQYKQINKIITEHWKSQGKHAFFHHISGIFAYEPLEMRF